MIALKETAAVADGVALCPYCGAAELRYCEEVTICHRVIRITSELVVVDAKGDPEEEAMDARFICGSCGEPSAIPDYLSVEFE